MRYPSLDIARALAIILMVMVHFCENLSGYTPPFTGLSAPLFAFVSGVSYRLWVNGLEARGRSDDHISKATVRRGLAIFGIGLAFNVLVWLPEDVFSWDVLTFIGFALIVLDVARRLPLSLSVLCAIIALALSPVLREWADYPAYWETWTFEYDFTMMDVASGFLVTGYFPVFPWIAYSLTGFVMASLLFAEPPEARARPGRVGLVGAMLMAAALALLAVRPHVPEYIGRRLLEGWSMNPPAVEYVLGTIGMALLLFWAAHRWVDCNPRARRHRGLLGTAKTFSRYSLTIYIVHHLVHVWPLWIYGLATRGEATYYYQDALPVPASLLLALVFVVVCYIVLRRVGPDERHGVEAWIRWLSD